MASLGSNNKSEIILTSELPAYLCNILIFVCVKWLGLIIKLQSVWYFYLLRPLLSLSYSVFHIKFSNIYQNFNAIGK